MKEIPLFPKLFDSQLIFHGLSPNEKIRFSHILEGRDRLDLPCAEWIAKKIQSWAIQQGATQYNYWFQPSISFASEKSCAFLDEKSLGIEIAQFNGLALHKAAADVSRFSSRGGFGAQLGNGFLSWDVSMPPFIWEDDKKLLTLWIPSLFSSPTGDALDLKIPLLKSIEKVSAGVMRLLKLCDVSAQEVVPELEIKQCFYVVDRELFDKRPDLALTGRAVYGAKFSSSGSAAEMKKWKRRLVSFIHEVEEVSSRFGSETKISLVEGECLQYVAVSKSQKVALAIDLNVFLMKIMLQIGLKHDVVPLFHEKPFYLLPRSDKCLEWRLSTQDGDSLLDCSEMKSRDLLGLVLATAMTHALYENKNLFLSSFISKSHDKPLRDLKGLSSSMTIDLGCSLSGLVDKILSGEPIKQTEIGLGLALVPERSRETFSSVFCRFTGPGFEFRGLSASAHPAFAVCVIQSAIADSLQLIVDEIADSIGGASGARSLFDCILSVSRKHLSEACSVIFDRKRRSPVSKNPFSWDHFEQFVSSKTIRTFESVMNAGELQSVRTIYLERYARTIEAEMRMMTHLFRMKILPALNQYRNEQKIEFSHQVHTYIEQAIIHMADLDKLMEQMRDLGEEVRVKVISEIGIGKIAEARLLVDELEETLDLVQWPIPKLSLLN